MIELGCPVCGNRLDVATRACAAGHRFEHRAGVLRLLRPDFARTLESIERDLSAYRKSDNKRIEDPAIIRGLPFNLARNDPEWAIRARDAVNVLKLLPRDRGARILDLGAWNGWLCRLLAERGHTVVGVDYFADEYDGLGAVRHHAASYDAIQMDVADLSPIACDFDLVIVNHGLAFFTDPMQHLLSAFSKVRVGGVLVVLGLQFYHDVAGRQRQIRRLERRYREHTGRELFFRPTRGLLDWNDRKIMNERGFRIRPYNHLWWRNLLSMVRRRRPYFCYASMVRQA